VKCKTSLSILKIGDNLLYIYCSQIID